MVATIEKLIELDFDEPALQRTPIILNQANNNSVVFKFKIYKGSNEIRYADYSRAELVFQKAGGVNVIDNGTITSSGITYLLRKELFDTIGQVKGYINLYTTNTISATLLFDYSVISDLIDIKRISQFYVRTIEELAAELNVTVEEARRILEGLQKDAFVSEAHFNSTVNVINDKVSKNSALLSEMETEIATRKTKIGEETSVCDIRFVHGSTTETKTVRITGKRIGGEIYINKQRASASNPTMFINAVLSINLNGTEGISVLPTVTETKKLVAVHNFSVVTAINMIDIVFAASTAITDVTLVTFIGLADSIDMKLI